MYIYEPSGRDHKIRFLSNFIVLLSIILSNPACKKFIEIDPPKDQLVTATVFESEATGTSAIRAVYSQILNDNLPYNIALLTGLSGDELKNNSNSTELIQFYTNTLIPTTRHLHDGLWTSCYKYIYQANAIIEGINNSKTITQATKDRFIGEAKFIRAFFHFYLVNIFGEVPIVTTTDYKINSIIYKSPVPDVFEQILIDLKEAKSLLKEEYVDGNNKLYLVDPEKVRPNKWAASMMIARVTLHLKDYLNVEREASEIINSGAYGLVPLHEVFLKNNNEAIWQLQPVSYTNATPEGTNFIITSNPSSGFYNTATISDQLLNSFENGDNRKSVWLNHNSDSTFFYPYKYRIRDAASITEYSTVFRLAECYIIRAEVRALQDDLAGAIDDLNYLRARAGLTGLSIGLTQQEVLDAVEHERRVEYFAEWGCRWINLKRTNRIDSVMESVSMDKGSTWESFKQLYPIPQRERDNDPNLSQNLGY